MRISHLFPDVERPGHSVVREVGSGVGWEQLRLDALQVPVVERRFHVFLLRLLGFLYEATD